MLFLQLFAGIDEEEGAHAHFENDAHAQYDLMRMRSFPEDG